jgi:DNA-binding transcriptional ArsR family regulator
MQTIRGRYSNSFPRALRSNAFPRAGIEKGPSIRLATHDYPCELTHALFTYNSLSMKASRQTSSRQSSPPMTWEALELVAARFRAMGEPLRLRILQELQGGERSVSALAERVESTQPNVSKHLKVLQDTGLVRRRQQGTSVYYSIADEMVFELCHMICTELRDRLEAQVGALGRRARA